MDDLQNAKIKNEVQEFLKQRNLSNVNDCYDAVKPEGIDKRDFRALLENLAEDKTIKFHPTEVNLFYLKSSKNYVKEYEEKLEANDEKRKLHDLQIKNLQANIRHYKWYKIFTIIALVLSTLAILNDIFKWI